jgi:hypothetical protein
MGGIQHFYMDDLSRYRASITTKVSLSVLVCLYGFGAFAAFSIARSGVGEAIRDVAVANGFHHSFVAVLCAVALLLSLLRSKYSLLATGIAISVVGIYVVKAMVVVYKASRQRELNAYDFIEPGIVFPLILVICLQLMRACKLKNIT